MRTPSIAGSPTFTPASRFFSAATTSSTIPAGTNVRRIAVHFCPAFTVISFTTSFTKRSNSSLPGAASGPSMEKLSESASWLKRTLCSRIARPLRELQPGRGRPGERDGVLTAEMIEQVARAAADELEAARRQDARLDDGARDDLGEVARHRGRLHDARHAREERRRELLQHPPHGEVEGVDLHRDAFERHADVPADERAALAERLGTAVDVVGLVGELAPSAARVGEQRADAAVDVDPGVASAWRP